jgi:hypothetical protein
MTAGSAPSIAAYLEPDGRLDERAVERTEYTGPVDLTGYRAGLDPRTRAPVFSRLEPGASGGEDASWWNGFGDPGSDPRTFDGTVECYAVYQGQLIAAGRFTKAGSRALGYVARWDGHDWQPLGGGRPGEVRALVVYNGELVTSDLAIWNGSAWRNFTPGISGCCVLAMAVYQGNLVVGGAFSSVGGVSASNIARWNGSSWASLGTGVDTYVEALTVFGSDLIAGGQFTQAGGIPVRHLARWNGSAWSALSPDPSGGVGGTQGVFTLCVHGTDLIVGGDFTQMGDVPASCIARWDGSRWNPLGSGLNNWALNLASVGGTLVATGNFTVAGGTPVPRVARWDGATWSSLGLRGGPGAIPDGAPLVGGLGVRGDTLYASDILPGDWLSGLHRVMRWDGRTWSWLGAAPGIGAGVNGSIHALAVYDHALVAGGEFFDAGGVLALCIARWNGRTWSPLGTGFDHFVRALVVYGGGLVAGGDFTHAGLMPAAHVALWNGSSWSTLGEGLNRSVMALTVKHGELVAAGTFTSAGGRGASKVATWDGVSWSPLGYGLNSDVNALAVYRDTLIAAGAFVASGPVALGRIARWDGDSWEPLGSGLNSTAQALEVFDGILIAGGSFTRAGGLSASSVARWDGSVWSTLGVGTNSLVQSLKVHAGRLFAGGAFTQAGAGRANSVARWDGATWSSLAAGTNGSVFALASDGDSLFAGGSFRIAGSGPSRYVARWDGDPAPPDLANQEVTTGSHAFLSVTVDPGAGGVVRIRYTIQGSSLGVRLTIYDPRGRLVRKLQRDVQEAGLHEAAWDRRDDSGAPVVRGMYLVELRAGEHRMTRKLLLWSR